MPPSRSSDDLVNNALQYLSEHGYAEGSISHFRGTWNGLLAFVKKHGILDFTLDVEDTGAKFLKEHYEVPSKNFSAGYKRSLLRRLKVLYEFNEFGEIRSRHSGRLKKIIIFNFKPQLDAYLDSRRESGLKKTTIEGHEYHLRSFFSYLEKIGVSNLLELAPVHIYKYLEAQHHFAVATKELFLYTFRKALRFYCEAKMCNKGLLSLFPVISVRSHKPIPSCYCPAEMSSILSQVDRKTIPGKRDYLVLLLAMLLGMRAGDIRTLEFNNIKWREEAIEYTQEKTGTPTQLPMPDQVRLALLDYLKHSRPKVNSPFIFVKLFAPYSCYAPHNNFYYIFQKYLRQSGIESNGRKHGLHSLRSSFANNMLQSGTPMPTISHILGHQYQDTTNASYLKVDILQLKQAALEPPL